MEAALEIEQQELARKNELRQLELARRKALLEVALNKALIYKSNRDLCELFIQLSTTKLVCVQLEEKIVIYKWDADTTLYQKIGIIELSALVMDELGIYLETNIDSIENDIIGARMDMNETQLARLRDRLKNFQKLRGIVFNLANVKKVAALVAARVVDKTFYAKLDMDPHVINCTNVLIDLRTGHSRYRTPKDFFSKTLDFRYTNRVDPVITANVQQLFLDICNGKPLDDEAMKQWLGYSMTGLTTEQMAMWAVGYTAANGKSTLSIIFMAMFSIYCMKFNNRLYDIGYEKSHKQYAESRGIRYAVIEEANTTNMDIQGVKDDLDGCKKGSVEIMYGTCQSIQINFKLHLISNFNANFKVDRGIRRRFLYFAHETEFLHNADLEAREDKTNCRLLKKDIRSNCEDPAYKLALFQILLPYALRYYEKMKLDGCSHLKEEWEAKCDDNDKMAEFIDKYYTKGGKNMVYKEDFVRDYRKFTRLDNIGFANISNDISRLRIKYDRQKESGTDTNGVRRRGFLMGLKRNDARLPGQDKEQKGLDAVDVESTEEEVIDI